MMIMDKHMTPPIIEDMEKRLYDLLMEDSSPTIAAEKVAEFLGIDPMCLRDAAEKGKCPFGFGYEGRVNRYARFFKLPLYKWLTKT